jgi:hypothetical protein
MDPKSIVLPLNELAVKGGGFQVSPGVEHQCYLVFYSGVQSSTYGSIRSAVASLLLLPCEVNLKTGIEPELPPLKGAC